MRKKEAAGSSDTAAENQRREFPVVGLRRGSVAGGEVIAGEGTSHGPWGSFFVLRGRQREDCRMNSAQYGGCKV